MTAKRWSFAAAGLALVLVAAGCKSSDTGKNAPGTPAADGPGLPSTSGAPGAAGGTGTDDPSVIPGQRGPASQPR